MFDFKGLVDSLFRRQKQEGVYDLKSATQWMQQLPQSDIHQAQTEIVKSLISLNNNTKISLKDRVRTVLYLDEKAQSLQQHLCDVFFGKKGLGEEQSRIVLPTILSFWHEMANAYRQTLKQYTESPNRSLESSIELVVLRASHHFAMQAMWSYLRYLELDSRVWRNLNRLYLYAETEGFANKLLPLYPNEPETSVSQLYLQAMLLQLATPDKRQQIQIRMIQRWLTQWTPLVTLESQIRPHRQEFAVNLDEAKPPMRLRRNMAGDRYRYWETDKLQKHLAQLIERIRQGESEQLRLGEDFRLPAGLQLLEDLQRVWSKEGSATVRKHERSTSQRSVQVVHGLDDVIKLIKNPKIQFKSKLPVSNDTAVSVQMLGPATQSRMSHEPELFQADRDEWLVENESLTGFAANYQMAGNKLLAIGELVGLRSDDEEKVAVGVVRRMHRNKDNKVQVGIETICQAPVQVDLSPVDGKGFVALYAPENPVAAIGRFLLLPNRYYTENAEMLLSAQGKSYRIRLQPAIEYMPRFVLANFNVLAKL